MRNDASAALAQVYEPDEDAGQADRYLAGISSTPLLSAAEEVELAKRIEAGLYARHLLGEDPGMPPRRRAELEAVAADGIAARDHMIRANLKLVVSIAGRMTRPGMPFLDVVQEGNLGLIRAVEKFDYTLGFKFSTYATWWIRQTIERAAAEKSRSVRLPVYVVDELARLTRIERELSIELGREPTTEELAKRAGRSPAKVAQLLRLRRRPVSLDAPVDDARGGMTLGDLIEDTGLGAEEIVEAESLARALRSLVDGLPARERLIVMMHFGLDDGRPRSTREIAHRVRLSPQRVRQLLKRSLAWLRSRARHAHLLG